MKYFFGMEIDGADTLKKFYNYFIESKDHNEPPNLYGYFDNLIPIEKPKHIFFLFDNELKSKRPLNKFVKYINMKPKDIQVLEKNNCIELKANLVLLTNPMVSGKTECQIEELFDAKTLNHIINGKTFELDKNKIDNNKHYGKAIFANYVLKNYKTIDFSNFIPILDNINKYID